MNLKYSSDRRIRVVAHVVMIFLTVCALLPFILLMMASFTEENTAIKYGFTFFPKQLSISAYQYIAGEWQQIGHAYLISMLVTVVGTLLGMLICTLLSYGLTRDFIGKKFINIYVVFTMLFNGGIVSTYYIYSNVFHIKNTIWALIIPGLLLNVFNIMYEKAKKNGFYFNCSQYGSDYVHGLRETNKGNLGNRRCTNR